MKETVITMQVSDKEADLLELMRDYVRSYPNGHPQLLYEAQKMFDELIDSFSRDE